MAALAGVGDPKAGQWSEWTGKAFHLRRRLTSNEEKMTGPVIDIRGTTEAMERVRNLSPMAQAWAKRIGEVGIT